ncbi:MAG: AAA-like domain-containing protein [Stigonema ocellatum SAG 48.90 = DSM 106950]|nr:AAA-like domain-containing protein [Stigonema ocellatum SAG 48.90 = DSM 106950]
MTYKYEFNATLSEKSPTYVRREADNQLYESLKTGNFCYVFNARKTGKSSLRVQVMSRLKKVGVACSIIDISGGNIQQTTLEQWYAGILNNIKKDFNLDVNLRSWIKERNWLSPLDQFREFIESILLRELSEDIVIFIDEIDSVLSLNFPSDDFFAFIRACHNRRVDVPEYNRLTFCLLGVATPSDLIADKKRTPFNIGRAIELTGFTLSEAKVSLIQGLVEKVDHPEAVLKEVLEWTQGQPFLTQKLCNLVIDKAESKQPNIEQIVQKYLIQNWQSQDEPEHLRTIRDRITSNERRAGRMLGIYQQILLTGSVAADDSSEQGKMSLSGLVVKQEGKLKVYNRIYECVFNLGWVEKELAKLRPYAEALKAWIDSGCTDESRLLRGEALNDALGWAANKSLGDRDYQFFAACQELKNREIEKARELEKLEAEINLEAERKKLEAQAKANKILKAANQKAKKQIRLASTILVISLVAAMLAGIWATKTITETRTAVRLERDGVNAIRQFESQEIEPLLLAMQAGQELKELVKDGRPLEKYPADSPQLALQAILDNIHEQNQLKGDSASFSPDGQRIVTASDNDNTPQVWDINGKLLAQLNGHTGKVTSASFSPDGQRIVTASSDKTARVWDISGKLLAQLNGHTGEVWSASFSPDGQRIVTTSENYTPQVWDISGKLLAQLKGNSASFSPDGQRIVTVSYATPLVWDISGKLLAQLIGHTGVVRSASFSPDGQRIVTASFDKTALVWDISGKLLAQLKGHTGEVTSASFSRSGGRIVTASTDKTARVWEVWDISGKQLAQLKGHTGVVRSASFSPDGQRIVTASFDKTARVWDISGKLLAQLNGHTGEVWSASFSPDGQRIVTGSVDQTARVWRVEDLNQLLVRGCKWLNNYLITHPKDLEKLEVCQNKSNIIEAVPFLVKEGEEQAREGNTDDAVATFRQALKWNPKLKLDPETKAKQIAEASKLVEKGKNLLKEGKVEDAVAVFQLALKRDPNLNSELKTKAAEALLDKGKKLVGERKIKEAIAAYTQAQKLQPEFEISAYSWNSLCWQGSLLGYAADVMYACEKAVVLAPSDRNIRDSRGLARALTGNTNGAIEDFQAFIAQTKDKEKKSQRQHWIDALRAGKKPFTDEELKKLEK